MFRDFNSTSPSAQLPSTWKRSLCALEDALSVVTKSPSHPLRETAAATAQTEPIDTAQAATQVATTADAEVRP